MTTPATPTPAPTPPPTPTVPTSATGLAKNIAIAIAAFTSIGTALTAFLKAKELGPIIVGGFLVLALVGIVLAYLRRNDGIDNWIVYIATAISLAVVVPTIAVVLFPYVQSSVTKLGYDLLPKYTSEAAQKRSEDVDVRTADGIDPIGTGSRKQLRVTRKQLDTRTAAQLAKAMQDALNKKCNEYNPVTQTVDKDVPCSAATLQTTLAEVLEKNKANLKTVDQVREQGDPLPLPNQSVWGHIKNGWSSFIGWIKTAWTGSPPVTPTPPPAPTVPAPPTWAQRVKAKIDAAPIALK